MSDAATPNRAGTRSYQMRGVSPHAVNFAKGVLIGGIVVMSLWLLLASSL